MSAYQPECGPPEPDRDIMRCWCGVSGTYEELFDDDTLDDACGGFGVIHCYCGGDLCVCHHHGETQCDGCEACEGDDPDDFWNDDLEQDDRPEDQK